MLVEVKNLTGCDLHGGSTYWPCLERHTVNFIDAHAYLKLAVLLIGSVKAIVFITLDETDSGAVNAFDATRKPHTNC